MSISTVLGESHDCELPQGTIRYRECGHGRPIVFVHGYLVNGDLWRKVVPLLAGRFRCITPDWPFGAHELPMPANASLSPHDAADLVADFIAALGLDDVVLVANDSGGAICQIVVTRRPERIGALVLTPCDAFDDFPPAPFKLIPRIARTPVLRDMALQTMRIGLIRRAAFRPLMRHGYDSRMVRSWATASLKNAGIRRDANKFAGGMDPKFTREAAGKLPQFDRPALLVWPPKNTFFKYASAQKLAGLMPKAQLEPVEDSLTFLPEDQPDRLADLIASFAR